MSAPVRRSAPSVRQRTRVLSVRQCASALYIDSAPHGALTARASRGFSARSAHFPPPLHLRIPIPPTVRWLVRLRCGGRCEDCTERLPLEPHHLRYRIPGPLGGPIFGRETVDDLAALCRDCHHARHIAPDGTFWPDPQAMARHWERYDE